VFFLIGYRGSGKSTVGRRLADRLLQEFLDSDDLIVRQAGMTIRDIFDSEGEDGFRDRESTVVARAGALPDDHVIALGAGRCSRKENRDALAMGSHKVIYLKCEPAELHRRIHADPQTAASRPALTALAAARRRSSNCWPSASRSIDRA
jgi:shikimate kinase